MSKESFEDYWKKHGNEDAETIRFCCFHTWNHQHQKIEKLEAEKLKLERAVGYWKAINKSEYARELEKENQELREALKQVVKLSEYGARQWADAWNGGKETNQIIAINKAKELLNKGKSDD